MTVHSYTYARETALFLFHDLELKVQTNKFLIFFGEIALEFKQQTPNLNRKLFLLLRHRNQKLAKMTGIKLYLL